MISGARTGRELGRLLVIAKEPRPGTVKTRLSPAFAPDQAAALAAAALADTLTTAAQVAAAGHVLVFDGTPPGDLAPVWQVIDQVPGGLDLRLAAAFAAVESAGPALLIGMDTPQLRPPDLEEFRPDEFDACLGPATDGGFWAIGFADPARAATTIRGVPMSRADTGAIQLDRMRAAGLRVQVLEEFLDFDTAESARQVALADPGSTFAATWRGLRPALVS